MKNLRDLRVREKAHLLVLGAYRSTESFPKQELFGLTSQIRRAAAAIAANIAEGCGKHRNGESQRFLNVATDSASELEYHLLLVHDLHFLNDSVITHGMAMWSRSSACSPLRLARLRPTASRAEILIAGLNAEC